MQNTKLSPEYRAKRNRQIALELIAEIDELLSFLPATESNWWQINKIQERRSQLATQLEVVNE